MASADGEPMDTSGGEVRLLPLRCARRANS